MGGVGYTSFIFVAGHNWLRLHHLLWKMSSQQWWLITKHLLYSRPLTGVWAIYCTIKCYDIAEKPCLLFKYKRWKSLSMFRRSTLFVPSRAIRFGASHIKHIRIRHIHTKHWEKQILAGTLHIVQEVRSTKQLSLTNYFRIKIMPLIDSSKITPNK